MTFPQERLELSATSFEMGTVLEANFLSKEKRSVVCFSFAHVSAFRVLDEDGLTELWHASAKTPRPAQTTFRVRGHKWQFESELSWLMGGTEDFYSFMIATDGDCLEVVSSKEPSIELRPAEVSKFEVIETPSSSR